MYKINLILNILFILLFIALSILSFIVAINNETLYGLPLGLIFIISSCKIFKDTLKEINDNKKK